MALLAVVRPPRDGRARDNGRSGCASQGGANATNDARNGGEGRDTHADRGVAGALTCSGELYRMRETHRARLSATTGCGRTRRRRWWSWRGRRRPELAERGAPSVGGDGALRSCCCCCVGGREGESTGREAQMAAGVEADAAGHSWWLTRARPGCRMLATRWPSSAGAPRRHGAAVRARARRGRGEGGERGRAGPASASGPEVRPRPASAPLSLFPFFLNFFSQIFFLNSFGPF